MVRFMTVAAQSPVRFNPQARAERDTSALPPTTDREASAPIWAAPARTFERRMFTDGILKMPDGEIVPYWGFEDPVLAPGKKAFASPIIRIADSERVHIMLELQARSKSPNRANAMMRGSASSARDVVVDRYDSTIYQWQPRQAGTWFYQSHASTSLDFEMGLYGIIVVDPAPDAAGRPLAFAGGPAYDVERLWVLDDIDPVWHTAAPEKSAPPAADERRPFNPKYFLINGVPNTQTAEHSGVGVLAKRGDKLLIRLFNASYSMVKITLGNFNADIVSVDGTALATPDRPWTQSIPVRPNQPIFMATASRHDVLIDLDPSKNDLPADSRHEVIFEFLDLANRTARNSNAANPVHIGRAISTITIV
jgi:hypothetical protein